MAPNIYVNTMKYDNPGRFAASFSGYTELRVQENRSTRISLLNGDVVGNSRGAQTGCSARSFSDGVWGFASTPELDDDSVRAVIAKATGNARFLSSRGTGNVLTRGPLPSRPGTTDISLGTTRPRATQKELIDFVREIDAYIATRFPGLSSRSITLSNLDMEKTLVTSDGAMSYTLTPRSLVAVSLTMDADGEPVDLYDVFGGRGHFEDRFGNPSELSASIDVLADNLARKAKGVYARPGTHDVVLDSDLAGILAHEAIGHTVEADGVLGGSVAADAMGRQVASPLITMIDFANTALGQTCPVPIWTDDEGIDARDAVLIDKGILRSYMHNRESAAHFGVEPTGNARAYGFYDEPLIRMRNTAILPGKSRLSDMLSGLDNGYYFVKSSNGQADATSEFMFGVVLGFEVRGGKVGDAIRDTTISGVAFDMLRTVSAVSDDMSWSSAGMCGKKQSIPVGMGGPAVRCRVNVGGRVNG